MNERGDPMKLLLALSLSGCADEACVNIPGEWDWATMAEMEDGTGVEVYCLCGEADVSWCHVADPPCDSERFSSFDVDADEIQLGDVTLSEAQSESLRALCL